MAARVPFTKVAGLPLEAQRAIQRNFQELEKALSNTSPTGFDAIIDPDLTADDAAAGQFTTVGAALLSLKGSAWDTGRSVHLGMKGRATAAFGTTSAVTETGNIPSTSIPGGGVRITALGANVTWNLAAYTVTGTGSAQLTLAGVYVVATGANFPSWDTVTMFGGGIQGSAYNGVTPSTTSYFYATGSQLKDVSFNAVHVMLTGCRFMGLSTGTMSLTNATGGHCILTGCQFDAHPSGTTLHVYGDRAVFHECSFATTWSASDAQLTLSFRGGTDQQVYLIGGSRGGGGASSRNHYVYVDMNATTKRIIVIAGGEFYTVTTTGATEYQYIDGAIRTLDVTGTTNIGAQVNGQFEYLVVRGCVNFNARCTARGNGNAFTAVSWINSTGTLSAGPGGTAASTRPYTIDVGSGRNVLIVDYPASMLAGVNSSATTFVIDHNGAGSSVPSGPAGGDLGGTYPNPTVTDDSHAHTSATLTLASTNLSDTANLLRSGDTANGDLSGTYPNPTLDTTGVAAATYGDANNVPQIAVDTKGRITSASEVAVDVDPIKAQVALYNVTGATLTTAVETLLTWDTEVEDPTGMHSTATNPGRVTVATEGIYHVEVLVGFASNSTGNRRVTLKLNGLHNIERSNCGTAPSRSTYTPLSADVHLRAGDYLEVYALQDSGGNLAIDVTAPYSPKWTVRYVCPVDATVASTALDTTDTYSGADATTNTGRYTDALNGGARYLYTHLTGFATELKSNGLRFTSFTTDNTHPYRACTVDTGADSSVTATMVATPTVNNTGYGVVGRCTDKDNMYYLLCLRFGGTNYWYFAKVVAGTATNLASSPYTSPAPAANDVIKLTCSGTTITATINGTQLASVTDSSLTDTKFGIGAYQGNAPTNVIDTTNKLFDNLRVEPA